MESLKHFDFYLQHNHFVVYTDHSALQALKSPTKIMAMGRLARWQLLIQGYDCVIQHRAGAINTVPDFLSRMGKPMKMFDSPVIVNVETQNAFLHPPIFSADVRIEHDGSYLPSIECNVLHYAPLLKDSLDEKHYDWDHTDFLDELRLQHNADAYLRPIILYLSEGVLSSDPAVAKRVQARATNHTMVKGVFVQCDFDKVGVYRFILPEGTLRQQIVWHYHRHLFEGAHQNFRKTYDRLQRRFYFKGMFSYVERLISTCQECQRAKTIHAPKPAAPMVPMLVPEPMERIAIDFVGPLVMSNHGNKWMLVITDISTKWAEAYPLRDSSAVEVAACLADWVTRYGAPISMVSDRGSDFLAEIVRMFCTIWGIDRDITSPYHPQANGSVERLNATLCDMLRTFSLDTGVTWDEHIGAVLFAYRNAAHSTTQCAPAQLLFGRSLNTPLDAMLNKFLEDQTHRGHLTAEFVFEHAKALRDAQKIAQATMEKAIWENAQRFNRSHNLVAFAPGDVVWLQNMKQANKLSPRWLGPYRIASKTSEGTYHVFDAKGKMSPTSVRVEHMKRAIFDKSRSMQDQYVNLVDDLPSPSAAHDNSSPSSASSSYSSSSAPFSYSSAASAFASSSSTSNNQTLSMSIQPHISPLTDSSSFSSQSVTQLQSAYVPSSSFNLDLQPTSFDLFHPPPALYGKIRPNPFSFPQLAEYSGSEQHHSDQEYHVNRILANKFYFQDPFYLVEWSQFHQPTWEPATKLTHCQDAIDDFEKSSLPATAEEIAAQRVNPGKLTVGIQDPVAHVQGPLQAIDLVHLASKPALPVSLPFESSHSMPLFHSSDTPAAAVPARVQEPAHVHLPIVLPLHASSSSSSSLTSSHAQQDIQGEFSDLVPVRVLSEPATPASTKTASLPSAPAFNRMENDAKRSLASQSIPHPSVHPSTFSNLPPIPASHSSAAYSPMSSFFDNPSVDLELASKVPALRKLLSQNQRS